MKCWMYYLFAMIFFSSMNIIAMEPIEEIGQKEKPGAVPAQKKSEYTLKVPVAGTNKTIDEVINLDEITDLIAAETLADLLKAAQNEDRDFIIARVPTQAFIPKRGLIRHSEYYELSNINKFLFGGKIFPDNPNNVNPYNYKTPNRVNVSGRIDYFIFSPIAQTFFPHSNDFQLMSLIRKEGPPSFEMSQTMLAYGSLSKVQKYRLLRTIYNTLLHNLFHPEAIFYMKRAARAGEPLVLIRAGDGFKNLHEYENARASYQKAIENVLPEDDQNIKKQAQQALADLEQEIKKSQTTIVPPPELMPLPMELEKPAGKREHPEEEEPGQAAKKKK